jgi:mono/diheme cytochrome c family protein
VVPGPRRRLGAHAAADRLGLEGSGHHGRGAKARLQKAALDGKAPPLNRAASGCPATPSTRKTPPVLDNALDDEEIDAVIAYIRALR